jgi:hypothetical protein
MLAQSDALAKLLILAHPTEQLAAAQILIDEQLMSSLSCTGCYASALSSLVPVCRHWSIMIESATWAPRAQSDALATNFSYMLCLFCQVTADEVVKRLQEHVKIKRLIVSRFSLAPVFELGTLLERLISGAHTVTLSSHYLTNQLQVDSEGEFSSACWTTRF